MKKNPDKRSQVGLILGILAITLVVMLALFIPAGPRRASMKSQTVLEDARTELQTQEVARRDEADRLARQKQLMEILAKRPASFDLFAHVDGLLNKQGLRDRAQLEQFKPHNGTAGEPMVQLRLEGVAFDEIISLFHSLYSGGNLIAVYKMDSMRPATTGKGLDCDVTLVTLAAASLPATAGTPADAAAGAAKPAPAPAPAPTPTPAPEATPAAAPPASAAPAAASPAVPAPPAPSTATAAAPAPVAAPPAPPAPVVNPAAAGAPPNGGPPIPKPMPAVRHAPAVTPPAPGVAAPPPPPPPPAPTS